MSCPNWDDLARQRATEQREPEAWRLAVRHLDSCGACRQQAVASDPLLVFRARSGAPSERYEDAAEVVEMCRSVKAVVRSRDWESPRQPARHSAAWRQAAAVGLLAFLLLLLGPNGRVGPLPSAVGGADSLSVQEADRVVGTTSATELLDHLTAALPLSLVENVDRPGARVYELRRENLSLVMIIDHTLDV